MNHARTNRMLVTAIGAALLTMFTGACARSMTDAGPPASASPTTGDFALTGRWDGSFHGVAIGDKHLDGRATLEIKEDASFVLTEARPVGGSSRETGTVVIDGRRVTLRTSTGTWIMLDLEGEVLHGLATDRASGYPVHITVERQR